MRQGGWPRPRMTTRHGGQTETRTSADGPENGQDEYAGRGPLITRRRLSVEMRALSTMQPGGYEVERVAACFAGIHPAATSRCRCLRLARVITFDSSDDKARLSLRRFANDWKKAPGRARLAGQGPLASPLLCPLDRDRCRLVGANIPGILGTANNGQTTPTYTGPPTTHDGRGYGSIR
jgi:hypothetical protein